MKYLLSVAVLLSISIASEEIKDPFENINRATFEWGGNLVGPACSPKNRF